MNETTVFSKSDENAKLAAKLDEINRSIASISAKEVLFIIALSFLALFAAVNMCLLILERRNKKKQSSVPQAIVIQPNNAKSLEKKPSTKSVKAPLTSSNYEKDVLPSKSVQPRTSDSPSTSVAKKPSAPRAPSSKESANEETSKASEVEKKHKTTDNYPAWLSQLNPVLSEPEPPGSSSAPLPSSQSDKSSERPDTKPVDKPIDKSVDKPAEKSSEKSEKSEKSDTLEGGATKLVPKDGKEVTTPTETTLSGASTAAKTPLPVVNVVVPKESIASKSPAVAPPISIPVSTPVSLGPLPSTPPAFGPVVIPPPPNFPQPSSEKKI